MGFNVLSFTDGHGKMSRNVTENVTECHGKMSRKIEFFNTNLFFRKSKDVLDKSKDVLDKDLYLNWRDTRLTRAKFTFAFE